MVGLGAGGVDLAPHLLGDESQFFAGKRVIVNGFHEIAAVLAEADLLLIDVKLLYIVDHLLLEPALVRFEAQLCKS